VGSSDSPFPLPLPPGWVDRGEAGGHRIAAPARSPGPALLLCRGDAAAAAGGSLDAWPDVLVLDTEPVRCRGGGTADRTLVAVADEHGRSLTVEHWRYPPEHPVDEAVAVLPTGAYAQLGPSCTAALRGRTAAPAPDLVATAPEADLRVTVFAGKHVGSGHCQLADGTARVDLPGLDGPRDIPAALLPGWLAGLVGLGPRSRPAASGLLVTSRSVLDRLLALPVADPDRVRDAVAPSILPAGWARSLAALAGATYGHWRLDLTVPGGGTAMLEVLDAGGLWSLTPVDPALLASEVDGATLDDEPVAVSPVTPSAVWRWLAPLAG
jgi:hypothetical protein